MFQMEASLSLEKASFPGSSQRRRKKLTCDCLSPLPLLHRRTFLALLRLFLICSLTSPRELSCLAICCIGASQFSFPSKPGQQLPHSKFNTNSLALRAGELCSTGQIPPSHRPHHIGPFSYIIRFFCYSIISVPETRVHKIENTL